MQTQRGFALRLSLLLVATLCFATARYVAADEGPGRVVLLPPGPGNPRNSEGDFIQLEGGRILLVYTHFTGGGADHSAAHRGKRTPYNVAVSRDEGRSWQHVKTLEDDPDGWYCYTAVEFVGDHVLLAHCAGNRKTTGGLATTQITRFPLEWLYE